MSYATIDVDRLTRQSVAAVQERYDIKGVALRVHLQQALPPLWADEQRLSQVLGNLLDNALRHTPPGGQVDLSCVRDGDRLSIAVADTGEGIAPEHLARLFERFYRADAARDREHGGAGLGLAIAKALVQAHGGSISVASPGLGAGATFTVDLPAAQVRADEFPVTGAPART